MDEEMMNPVEVIDKAKDVLLKRGWNRQGGYRNSQGQVCVIGAVRCVVWGDAYAGNATTGDQLTIVRRIENALNDVVKNLIVTFNDVDAENLEHLFQVMDKAKELL